MRTVDDVSFTPSKKQRLEDDGLILLETPNEALDDDAVIVID